MLVAALDLPMIDPTEINPDSNSAHRFREEVQRENRTLLFETRRLMHDLNGRLTVIERDLHELKVMEHAHETLALEVHDLQRWRESTKGPLSAAENLNNATSGARMMFYAVTIIAGAIMAVAGVMHLINNSWKWLTQ